MGSYANRLIYTVGRRGILDFAVGQNRYDVVDLPPTTGLTLGSYDALGFIEDDPLDPNYIPTHEAMLESGDSGAPSFIVEGGLLQLAGIHSYIATDVAVSDFGPAADFAYKTPQTWSDASLRGISFDLFVPNYASLLPAAPIPEPSSLLLFVLLISALRFMRRR